LVDGTGDRVARMNSQPDGNVMGPPRTPSQLASTQTFVHGNQVPSIYVPGFRPSHVSGSVHVPAAALGSTGYQASHADLGHEFARRASLAFSVHNGEIINVKAIFAQFPRGSTKAVMIGVSYYSIEIKRSRKPLD